MNSNQMPPRLRENSANANAGGLSRRNMLKLAGGGMLALGASAFAGEAASDNKEYYKAKNGRINQSVIYWCFKPMPVPELAAYAARMGLKSVELVTPDFWPMLKENGLTCAIAPSHGFAKGFAHQSEHEECLNVLRQRIDECAAAGVPNVITFSGYRRGISDEEGIKNMVEGLKQVVGQAEKKKVTLCLEVLNSRVHIEMRGHPDYFADNLERGIEVCRQIGSERMKILFDIYHIQIMEGDLITRIRQYHPYIAHYHTAGNPGRNEIDETQEINYPAVMNAILATGYQGYVGQEFVPVRDAMASLSQAVKICDV
ncbi:MAG TPA: TIM barrel protein [Verrucomicrobiae bacterium]|nr:TIM barrel protein [Verrucomicrobiae bacterium]